MLQIVTAASVGFSPMSVTPPTRPLCATTPRARLSPLYWSVNNSLLVCSPLLTPRVPTWGQSKQCSEVLEAVVRLLSKGEKTAGKTAKAELVMREWSSMTPGCGCEGRYTPASSAPEPEESEAVKAAKAWGDIPKEAVTYESWLRERVSAVAET